MTVAGLDAGFILAPERYDPRRAAKSSAGTPLCELVAIVSEQIDNRKAQSSASYLVLDTGDAQEGIIRTWKPQITGAEIGSNKKRIRPGDVIVSRLRPYLRQVAFADFGLFEEPFSTGEVLVSTEFFVLRSKTGQRLGFLVPYLLSASVQEVLAASQEGGHHPRFNQQSLERLSVPPGLLAKREEISAAVERATNVTRDADLTMRRLVADLSE